MTDWIDKLAALLLIALANEPSWIYECSFLRGQCHHCRQQTDPGVWLVVTIEHNVVLGAALAISATDAQRRIDDVTAFYQAQTHWREHDMVDAARYVIEGLR